MDILLYYFSPSLCSCLEIIAGIIFVSCMEGYRESLPSVCSLWIAGPLYKRDLIYVIATERIYFVSTSKVSRLQIGTPLLPWNPPLSVKREILDVLGSAVLIFSLRVDVNTVRAEERYLFMNVHLPSVIFWSIVTRILEELASGSTIERERLSQLELIINLDSCRCCCRFLFTRYLDTEFSNCQSSRWIMNV